ncbi:MAG TPA: hypothetical protein VNK46_00960 [Nitrospiraceae bacterium]|jgi:hypothetical protein|nr:hypothetical protein [Nitrospiraceae bacterium]
MKDNQEAFMNPKACVLGAGLALYNFIVLACMPTFGYAQDFHQPENIWSLSSIEQPTGQALFQLTPMSPIATLLATDALPDGSTRLAQRESTSEAKTSKAAGKTGDKGFDASKKDDDGDEDEEEEAEDADKEDKGKAPATKGDKASEKS